MRATILAVLVAVLCLSMSARAEEIGPNDVADAVAADVSPAEVPAVEPEADEPGGITIQLPFYWDDLVDAGVSLLGIAWKALLTLGGGWILAKVVGQERAKVVLDAIAVNVDRTWDDMGREIKHKAADGKIDASDKQKLRNHCTTGILATLKGAAKALFESYSVAKVNALIAATVEKRKALAGK